MLNKYKNIILLIVLIFLIQLLVFWPSFKLSLWGDDWLAFWRYSRILDIDPSYGYNQGFNHVSYFLTPYGPQDINMGLLSKIFGFNPLPYYVISFILRFLLSTSVFFLIYKFTKNIIASFFSSLFMSITPVGLDTTNWVFNMTSYLGLVFAVVFVYFYLKSFYLHKFKGLLLGYLFLFLAIVVVPIRMHGALPLIVITEAFWLIFGAKKHKNIFYSFLRVFLFLVVIYTIKSIGTSFANPNESVERVRNGVTLIEKMVKEEGKKEVFLYPLANLGNMLLPDNYWEKIDSKLGVSIFGRSRPFPLTALLFLGLYYILVRLTLSGRKVVGRQTFFNFMILGIAVTFTTWIFYKSSPLTFSSPHSFGPVLVGGYISVYLVGLIIFKVINRKYLVFTFLTLTWPIMFIALPWLSSPYSIFNTAHRYLIASAVGVGMLIALLILVVANKKALLTILLPFIFIQGYSTNSYFKSLEQKRSSKMSEKVWSVLNKRLPQKGTNNFYVVYFEGDTTNGDVVHANAFFGFPPRRSLEEEIYNQYNIPLAITTYKDLVAMATFGGSLEAHAKKPEKIPLERIYAFRILGNSISNLVVEDITDKVRDDLDNKIREFERS